MNIDWRTMLHMSAYAVKILFKTSSLESELYQSILAVKSMENSEENLIRWNGKIKGITPGHEVWKTHV